MTYPAHSWLRRSLLLVALLAPAALTGCTVLQPSPPIPNARLDLDRSQVTLRPGERTVIWLDFSKMLYGHEPEGRYALNVSSYSSNYRVTGWPHWLSAQSRVPLRVEAARNASGEQGRVYVYVTDESGNVLTDSFGVRVQPARVQPAPVRQVPTDGAPLTPVVQPAPVVPVPLP